LTALVTFFTAYGQIPVGGWRDHLSWNTTKSVIVTENKIYSSNGVGICIYDPSTNELNKLTKINGLNDAGISSIQYVPSVRYLVTGYINGNIDIITDQDIYNIPDIKHNGLYTNKRINHIYAKDDLVYLSCSFGIVVIDVKLRRIKDTYIIGDHGIPVEVNAFTDYNGYFYAATSQGIKKADMGSHFLTDFSTWEKVTGIPGSGSTFTQLVNHNNMLLMCDLDNNIIKYNGISYESLHLPFTVESIHQLNVSGNQLLVSTSKALFIYDIQSYLLQNTITTYKDSPVDIHGAMMDNKGTYWIADNYMGLVQWQSANNIIFYVINGPSSNNSAAFRYKSDRLISVSGGIGKDGIRLNRQGEIHTFSGNQWNSIRFEGQHDFTDIDISADNPGKYYVSSWGEGVYVFEDGFLSEHYTHQNSPLLAENAATYCGGIMIDEENRLWVSNGRKTGLYSNKQWKISEWTTNGVMGHFTQDNQGKIWTILHNNGLWVFDKASVEKDQTDRVIGFAPYNYAGSAPIYQNHQITGTPDGIMWVGTAQGPVYYNNSSAILDGGNTAGYHPNRTGTHEPSHMYALLGSENILSVAIDGAHRKWFGTEKGGVFLINEDNAGEVRHFTVDNSPLLSNKVHDIAINDKTGEVFFATEYGIVSYRSDAVSSGDDFGKVYVFPNPVHPDYHGEITITGLIKDADVKITDIAGNLVYQTKTLGGQAVWDGRNQRGRRVASGVYLVFCTNEDGSKTHITKLLFIR
jgi:hypothetical protein